MRSLVGVGPLAWKRLKANWRLLSVLAFGILAAAALMAVSPVYTRVMNDLGLDYSLKQQLGSATRNSVSEFELPLGSTQAAGERSAIARLVAQKLSWLIQSEARYGALPDLTLTAPGQTPPPGRAATLVTLETLSGLDDHARVVEGRAAQATEDPAQLEAVMPLAAARFLGLKPGDRIGAAQLVDDCNRPPPTQDPREAADRARFPCVPQASTVLAVSVLIAGFVDPADPAEPYWSAGRVYFERPQATENSPPIVPVLLPESSFYQALPRVFPGIGAEFRLTGFVDISRLNSANIDRARADLAALRMAASDRNGIADLATEAALNDFHARAAFNQIPLLLLLLQIVGIALYYVVLVATMVADRRSEEIALLRSRGATVVQVVGASAVEAGILAAGAAVLAPFLAAAMIAALGKTGTFHSVSGGHLLPFVVPLQAFGLALAGAALAVLMVLVPAFFAARRGIVDYLQASARPAKPFMQRYYIDVALAGLAALALWELNQRGSVFDPHSVGGWSADPVLLLSPVLLIVAVGALMFRFLPLVLGVIGRALSVTSGPGVTLGLFQLTRSPSRYTQLALLVVMAGAVGVFAATYGETTDRSQEDRARFQTGVDVRVTNLGNLTRASSEEVTASLQSVAGVEKAATAFRTELSLGPLPGFNGQVPVLAVDPAKAPGLVWFRDDFAGEDKEHLFRNIYGSPVGGNGILLPGEPVSVSLWAAPGQARNGMTLWLRTRDGRGVFRLHELGALDYTGYRQLTAMLAGGNDDVQYPVSMLGLLMTQAGGQNEALRAAVLFDDISTRDAAGNETIVEDFEGAFRWEALRTATMSRDSAGQVNQGQRRGNGGAQYAFRLGATVPVRGMYLSDANIPLAAIASQRFLDRMHAKVGNEVELVVGSLLMPVKITAAIDLFPTMADTESGFLLLNEDDLYFFAALTNQDVARRPNEAWLTVTNAPAARQETIEALQDKFGIVGSSVVDSEKVLAGVRSDPVVRAGGSGILLVSLVSAFLLLGLGFGLTLYAGGQARGVEISVVRAIGFSRGQIILMIGLEYLVVAILGLAIGALAGLRISQTMLTFLNVTQEGARIVPPFVLSTRWGSVALAYVFVVVAFIAGIGVLGAYFLRLPVSRILRLTR